MGRPLLAAFLIVVAAVACAQPAAADLAQATIVSADPVDWTPHVLGGTVCTMAVVGDTMVVGGTFTKVADSSRRSTYARKNIFAFNLTTGAVQPFAPEVDGPVSALAAVLGDTVYIGGAFKTV